jgi:hypothetical protein
MKETGKNSKYSIKKKVKKNYDEEGKPAFTLSYEMLLAHFKVPMLQFLHEKVQL